MTLPKPEEKEQAVQEMFTSIAPCYDLNNSLLSFGFHHRWKRLAVHAAAVKPGDCVLDLCSGTGDLALQLGDKIGPRGKVVALDLNKRMLQIGWNKVQKAGLRNQINCLIGTAEILPFPKNTFNAITVAFGIRNVTEIKKVLDETHRVLRPGGRMVCLEFSIPQNPVLKKIYHIYSFTCLPWLASWVSRDQTGTYHYLPASIRNFPNQDTFRGMMMDTGFSEVAYQNLSGGIVAIHTGQKEVR